MCGGGQGVGRRIKRWRSRDRDGGREGGKGQNKYIYIYIAAPKRQIFVSFHLGFPAPGPFETPLP
jgi:hypothetical protein